MGRREEEIEETIRNKVFIGCFGAGDFPKGKKILQKLYFQYYPLLDNMETKRLILYNYIVAECMEKEKNEDLICKLVIQLKNDMDKEPNYKEKCTGKYLDMMSYYTDREDIKLSDKEKLEYYNISCNYFKKSYKNDKSIVTYIKIKNMEFNINRIKKNFLIILDIVKDLHNINNAESTSTLKQMLCDIKNMDEQLYDKALETIKNTSKLCV